MKHSGMQCALRKGRQVILATATNSASLAETVRGDFPVLRQKVHGDKDLIYLDNAATSQKPVQVLEVVEKYYRESNANVHRGAHALSVKATDMYEGARDKVAKFVNAGRDEIVFTRGATEALNLVAYSWGANNLQAGDEILVSVMEHHANIVPWQMVAKRTGAVLKHVKLSEDESLDMEDFRAKLSDKTKLVALVHVSNTLGCVNDVKAISAEAHAVGAKVMVDACQSVPHMPVDVKDIDCDWLVASGHKMCAPMGSGFLYGKIDVLREMPPWQGGGEMIDEVFLDYSTFAEPPGRFEAGTPSVGECVGLGAACDFLTEVGMDAVAAHEHHMTKLLLDGLDSVKGLRVYGPGSGPRGDGRAALAAFNHEAVQASDLATFMDMEGVAVRSGHHCTQPLHRHFGVSGSCRASAYLYTTEHDIERFVDVLGGTIDMFSSIDDSFDAFSE